MGRRVVAALVIATLLSVPASAQWVVFDPANYAQAVLIAQRTLQTYEQLQAQYQLIMRMSEGLRGLDRYRIPDIAMSAHDTARSPFGRQWLEGLNSGDARGTAYMASVVPLQRPGATLDRLSPAARRVFENVYATVEVSDSVANVGRPPGRADAWLPWRAATSARLPAAGRAERPVRHSPDDGRPRQDLRGGTDRATPGHGLQPVAVARSRAVAGAEQTAERYGGRNHQHAADDLARRPLGGGRLSSRRGRCPESLAATVARRATTPWLSTQPEQSCSLWSWSRSALRQRRVSSPSATPPPLRRTGLRPAFSSCRRRLSGSSASSCSACRVG